MTKKRVLVVDDSPLIRQVLADMLSSEADLEVVGFGINGLDALEKLVTLKPDVITLDIEMPLMGGLETLREIMIRQPTPTVMVSSTTTEGADITLEALEIGATDFVCKPRLGSFMSLREAKHEIVAKIRTAATSAIKTLPASTPLAGAAEETDGILLIAASTGGPTALCRLFSSLPKQFGTPILIVQHMPASFTASLAKRLTAQGSVPCREAAEGDVIEPGHALIAPGGWHMTVGHDMQVHLDQTPCMHGVRPCADRLFESAAFAYGDRCLALILTGMGKDGAKGALAIRNAGGTVLAQSAESCTIFGMPKAAIESGAVQATYPLDELGGALLEALSRRRANAA